MPELPDVQVLKEYLDATSLHQAVEHVYVSAERTLSDVSPDTLRSNLEGRELAGTRRHGKELFARVDDDAWLRLHFGMTGSLEYFEDGDAESSHPDHTRLRLDFEGGGHLAFLNPRRLGQIGWVESPDSYIEEEGLGPDALSDAFDVDHLRSAFDGKRATVKSALMDQGLVAGIGNVYADEILFQAGIHPEIEAGELDPGQVREIHRQTRRVLEAAIDARVEDFPDWFLVPRRESGGACPECGGELEKTEVSGRPTWFCPEDQPRE